MSVVKQEFEAVGDEKLARAYEKVAKECAKLTEENQRLRNSTRLGAEEAERARAKALRQLEEEVRRTNDLKRARQELIATTNFTRTSRDGGPLSPVPGAPNYTTASRDGGAMIVRPDGTMIRPSGAWAAWEEVNDPVRNPNALSRSVNFSRVPPGGRGPGMPSWASGGSHLGGFISQQVADIAKVAAAWISVEKALEAVNYQYELTKGNQLNAAQAQANLARGQAEIVLNSFGETDEEIDRRFAAAKKISFDTGVPHGLVATTLGRQGGRGAGLQFEQLEAASRLAARLTRHTPEQYEPMATALQQAMRIGKLSDVQAGSLITSAGAAAFIGEPWQQARFLQQVLSSGVASVPNPTAKSLEEILELGGYITQRVGEERGEAGRTSSIALLGQFQEFREGRGAWSTTGPYGRKMQHPVKGAPTDPKDMIEWFWRNPRQAKRFVDKATFERMFEEPWRNLILNKSPDDRQLYEDTQALVTTTNQQALEDTLRRLERGSPSLKSKTEADLSANRQTVFQEAQTIQSRRNEARTIRDHALRDTDLAARFPSWLASKQRGLADSMGSFFPDSLENRAIKELRFRKTENEYHLGPLGTYWPREMTPDRQQTSELLDQQIKRLEEIRDEIKQLRQNRPGAAPAMNAQRGAQRER